MPSDIRVDTYANYKRLDSMVKFDEHAQTMMRRAASS